MGWRNPIWHPSARLRVCVSTGCDKFTPDPEDAGECVACGLPRDEHQEDGT